MPNDDLREFLLVLRQALLTIVYFIDDKYSLAPPARYQKILEIKHGLRVKN